MRTLSILTTVALSLTYLSACKAITKKDMAVGAEKSIKAEQLKVLHRPTEVTYEFGSFCEGESSTSKLLGFFRMSGDPTAGGGPLSALFGGGGAGLDANGSWAAARAIDSGNAEGLYVTRVEQEKNVVFPLWTKRTYVKGKCMTLKELGTISKERDQLRRFGYESVDAHKHRDN